jgi:NosR/NirI family transcriptional regulator, nitrous oxide reductase regulator
MSHYQASNQATLPSAMLIHFNRSLSIVVFICFVMLIGGFSRSHATPYIPDKLSCTSAQQLSRCQSVLRGAVRFESLEHTAYQVGYDESGTLVGWLALSTDVVDIQAYSGKPLVTLVGVDHAGKISGARVIHHSEPILLLGIPESALINFVDWYSGKLVNSRVVVGHSDERGVDAVDGISGATVTALAQNQTILDVARQLSRDVGVLTTDEKRDGHFIEGLEPLTWAEMEAQGIFGRLYVSDAQMGRMPKKGDHGQFINLWYTIADAPQVGRAIFGDNEYKWLRQQQKKDEHLFVILGSGSSSFKGSGFVRGGIFDRVRVEQGLRQIIFRDTDYRNLSRLHAKGAPRFKEGAVFMTREGKLRPGEPFSLVFMGSRYDGKGGFSREFHSFNTTHQLPPTIYEAAPSNIFQGGDTIYEQAWRLKGGRAALLSIFILIVMLILASKLRLTRSATLLSNVHLSVLLISVLVGILYKAQPSITQVLTLMDGTINGWRWTLYLSEPMIFVFWISIIIILFTWGRGVFCGWLCPFGALTDLLFKVGRVLKLPQFNLPEAVHKRIYLLRYVVLTTLVITFLYSTEFGEILSEIEPFKTSFLVNPWTRHWGFILWWVILLSLSLVWFRPFCRYICPLGAGLVLPTILVYKKLPRRLACKTCKICRKGCESNAFRSDGSINPLECLYCLECEVNYRDVEVCPPLVGIDALIRLANETNTSVNQKKLSRLKKQKEEWT